MCHPYHLINAGFIRITKINNTGVFNINIGIVRRLWIAVYGFVRFVGVCYFVGIIGFVLVTVNFLIIIGRRFACINIITIACILIGFIYDSCISDLGNILQWRLNGPFAVGVCNNCRDLAVLDLNRINKARLCAVVSYLDCCVPFEVTPLDVSALPLSFTAVILLMSKSTPSILTV